MRTHQKFNFLKIEQEKANGFEFLIFKENTHYAL